MIYMDNVVAARPRREAAAAMSPFLETVYGSPSSRHSAGRMARETVRRAREALARLADCKPSEVVFSSGPAESANLAIKGFFLAPGQECSHAIASAIEAPAILNSLRRLEAVGVETTILTVDSTGRVEPEDLSRALRRDTGLVSIQCANGEIGTVQDVGELIAISRERGARFLADASVSCGLLPLPGGRDGADMTIVSSNALGGPAGAGALIVREGMHLVPLIDGGVEEEGLRAELPATACIAGFGAAAAALPAERDRLSAAVALLGETLAGRLVAETGARLTGDRLRRLPGHVSVLFDGVEGDALLLELDRRGICASTGSPCADAASKASAVLRAIGLSDEDAHSSLVFSLGWQSSDSDIEALMTALPPSLTRLKALSGA